MKWLMQGFNTTASVDHPKLYKVITVTAGRSLNSSILREYDIRGTVGATLVSDDVLAIGRGFGSVVANEFGRGACVAVGYDGRLSSPNLFSALTDGLIQSGIKVINVGLGPTPMIYFATQQTSSHAGMMITGSHNPPTFNGIKMVLGGRPFYGNDIQSLGVRVKNGEYVNGRGVMEEIDVRDQYVDRLLEGNQWQSKIKVGWDPGNGAAGEIISRIIEKIDGEHFLINGNIDGNFPNHHPDPTVEENLLQLKKLVSEKDCDVGIGFDGDGDRIGVIDSQGRVIWADQLMVIWARDVLERLPGSTIIADVKTSAVFYDQVKKAGGNPVMWKTGHSLIKSKMAELNAPLAGEMSGHIFFADEYYGFDDAMYAALRLLRILTRGGVRLDELKDKLPFMFNTPELRFVCADEKKVAIVDLVRQRLKSGGKADICEIDGVRVETEYGWWLLRASNTQPALVARCESNSEDGLAQLKVELGEQLMLNGIDPVNLF